ncbi:hypothetical protein [Winogradskyella pulchriflava]|uniref:Secretion system C-terminal sorting domain-containing protein n=1 Tax=Winogradskyella pulchriflava TaxID=1110688 RepID=A0ABV6Q923_9FLAO
MENGTEKDKERDIYMSIDHLKKGKYQLRIIQENEVVKLVRIEKK